MNHSLSQQSFSILQIEVKESIATITINRPDKLNALNSIVMDELDTAIQMLIKDDSIRGCILTGAGDKSFVAGADISEFQNLTPEKAKLLSQKGQRIFLDIELCPKPIIALINGFALGGGCELALACHIRIATPSAKFGQPEINLGILPGYGGTIRLQQCVGKARATEMCLTGNTIDAQQALACGLVNDVLKPEEAKAKSLEILKTIALKSPLVVEKILKMMHRQHDIKAYSEEAEMFGACFYTKDAKEGIDAFLNKRKPLFEGK